MRGNILRTPNAATRFLGSRGRTQSEEGVGARDILCGALVIGNDFFLIQINNPYPDIRLNDKIYLYYIVTGDKTLLLYFVTYSTIIIIIIRHYLIYIFNQADV